MKIEKSEFEEVFKNTRRAVLNAISRYLDNRYGYAIDDVVQETYLRIFKALERNRLMNGNRLESYTYSIAKNESLRMNKRLQREDLKYQKLVDRLKNNIKREASETGNIRDYLVEVLNKNKDKIPVKYHEVLALYFLGDNENEISLKLDIKKGTVKSRKYRGLRLLMSLVQANKGYYNEEN